MATYFHDFADGIGDFTEIVVVSGAAAPTWSVVNTNELKAESASNHYELLAWNDIDSDADRADVECLGQFQFPASSTATRIFMVRVAGADTATKTLYYVRMTTSSQVIGRQVGATATTIESINATYSVDTFYWVRFRVETNGATNDLKSKIWSGAIGDEPASWDLSGTDDTYNDAGRVGPAKGANTATNYWRYFGVGTNGDTAPSSAPATGVTTGARNLLLLAAG